MTPPPLRVAKLGGSLLTYEPLAPALRAWLADDSFSGHTVLVVGGGPLVDGLREVDRRHAISESAMHWLCIQALSVTAQCVQQLLPELPLVAQLGTLRERLAVRGATLFEVQHFMRYEEPHLPGVKLPATWDVTTDSIAARLAIVLEAESLVLLKSSDPASERFDELVEAGHVDRFLPRLMADAPPIRCVNLRRRA